MTSEWQRAATFGIVTALIHRLILTIWLALAWSFISSYLPDARADFHATDDAQLPALTTPTEENLLGVWRRWDAVHYLDLATNGYRVEQAGSTVFGVLTPVMLRSVSLLTGGSADIASIVAQTIVFAVALTLLYRFCAIYYGDEVLGRVSVLTTALLPLSFYYAAPMSESLYLALSLGVFYLSLREKWFAAGMVGLLAALTRSQGAVLAVAAGFVLLETYGIRWRSLMTWIPTGVRALRVGWVLLLIPLGYVIFIVYRASIGLPSLGDTYAQYSYHFFVNPIEGAWINIRWITTHLSEALTSLDIWVMVLSFALFGISLRFPQHRRLPLVAFTLGHLLVYISKINWVWGTTDQVLYSQSFARYAIILFPLIILVADGIRRLPKIARIFTIVISMTLFLGASALYTLALVGP